MTIPAPGQFLRVKPGKFRGCVEGQGVRGRMLGAGFGDLCPLGVPQDPAQGLREERSFAVKPAPDLLPLVPLLRRQRAPVCCPCPAPVFDVGADREEGRHHFRQRRPVGQSGGGIIENRPGLRRQA